ncbi:MAG: hypothetical protein MR503_03910 [Oscillospiraceae bacterium]|nr:hypothetical protein [Oscillospiraceae bacterium]
MLYEIISSALSCDKRVCYFSYRHSVQSENGLADTYGISASDISGSRSINDVMTDLNGIEKLLDIISEKSVPVNSLNDFVENYIDEI